MLDDFALFTVGSALGIFRECFGRVPGYQSVPTAVLPSLAAANLQSVRQVSGTYISRQTSVGTL